MMKWGMRFNTFKPLEVKGRLLPPEEITFSRGSVQGNEKADWSMAFRSKYLQTSTIMSFYFLLKLIIICNFYFTDNSFLKAVPLKRWAMLYTSRDGGNIDGFIQTMRRVGTPLGFPFSDVDKYVVLSVKFCIANPNVFVFLKSGGWKPKRKRIPRGHKRYNWEIPRGYKHDRHNFAQQPVGDLCRLQEGVLTRIWE
jgi:hypothetical protein